MDWADNGDPAGFRKSDGQESEPFKGVNHPVETVSWDESQAYCRAIGGRLPTEAEWEYAARAGSAQSRYGDIDRIAWFEGNSGNHIHEVATKEPNAFGLYDMLGNVWQWTADWYEFGKSRTQRGGWWLNIPKVVRVSVRFGSEPGVSIFNVGFRCVEEQPRSSFVGPAPANSAAPDSRSLSAP